MTPGIGATFTAFTPEELGAAVGEAHKWNRGVASHAIGAEGVTQSVTAGVDSVEHCVQLTTASARRMAERGTFRGPTLCAAFGMIENPEGTPAYALEKIRSVIEDAERSNGVALRAKVRHVCSTDAGTPFNEHGNAPLELRRMVEWGMRPLDAMIAGTANGAELLRVPDIGTIVEGARADLVLYEDNPVEGIEALDSPRTVWKAGAVVAGRAPRVPSGIDRRASIARFQGAFRASMPRPRAARSRWGRIAQRGERPHTSLPTVVQHRRPRIGRAHHDRASVVGVGLAHHVAVALEAVDERLMVGGSTCSAEASSPTRRGPANTRTESTDRRGAEMSSASSSTRRDATGGSRPSGADRRPRPRLALGKSSSTWPLT